MRCYSFSFTFQFDDSLKLETVTMPLSLFLFEQPCSSKAVKRKLSYPLSCAYA